MKLSLEGDSLLYKTFDNLTYIKDFEVQADGSIYISGKYLDGAYAYICRLNPTNFSVDKITDILNEPEFVNNYNIFDYPKIEAISDTGIIAFTVGNRSGNPWHIQMFSMDSSFFFSNIKIMTGTYNESMPENRLFDRHIDGYFTVSTYKTPNRGLCVRNIDNFSNVVWEKYIQLDEQWITSGVIATRDGGCLITSTFKNSNQMGIRLIKLDANGNLPTNNENIDVKVSEQILYPNPGNSQLHIKTAIQKLGGEFILHDVAGKVVIQTTIKEQETNINTQNLPSGVYFHTYFYNNKKIESGKWVKD